MGLFHKRFRNNTNSALSSSILNIFFEKYSFLDFFNDVFAGIKIFILLFPTLISFAIACGESPVSGLKSGIAAMIVYCIIGSTKYQVSNISFPICVVTLEITTKYQYKGLFITSFFVCIILIALGYLRIGELFKYTANAFLSAIYVYVALALIFLQIQYLFGINLDLLSNNAIQGITLLPDIIKGITLIKLRYALIFLGSLIILRIIFKGYSSYFLYLILCVIMTMCSELNLIPIISNSELKTIGLETFNCLNSNNIFLLSYTLPSQIVISNLVIFAFAIAIIICAQVGFCISVGSCITFNKKIQTSIELLATGISNLVSVSCGGLFVSPDNEISIKNIQYGSKSTIPILIVSLLLFTVYYFKDNIFYHIPMYCISSILIVVSWCVIRTANIKQYFTNGYKYSDMYVFMATFITAFFFGFIVAVFIGFIFAILVFTQRILNLKDPLVHTNKNHDRIVQEFISNKYKYLNNKSNQVPEELFKQIELICINNILSINILEKTRQLLLARGVFPKFVIIYFQNIPFLDGEAFRLLKGFVSIAKKQECTVMLCGTNGILLDIIQKKEKELNERNVFGYVIPNFQDAINKILQSIKTK